MHYLFLKTCNKTQVITNFETLSPRKVAVKVLSTLKDQTSHLSSQKQ